MAVGPDSRNYDTALLDFHGTFTNNKGRTAHALNAAFQQVTGCPVSKETFIAVINRPLRPKPDNPKVMERIPVADFLRDYMNGALLPEDKERLIKTYARYDKACYIPKYRWMIRQLHDQGLTLAIITNGDEDVVTEEIKSWGVYACFEDEFSPQEGLLIYGRGKEGKLIHQPKKPRPEPIEHVLEELKRRGHSARRHRALFLGDHVHDIISGNKIGIHTAFIVTGPNQRPEDYEARPTFALLDNPSLQPNSPWLQREQVYLMRDLPKIVAGTI